MKLGRIILMSSILLMSFWHSTFACIPDPPPIAPTNLSATTISSTQINLSWTDNSSNETRFYIYRSPNGVDSWAYITYVGSNVTSYSNTGLTAGTRYYYRVRAYKPVATNYSSYTNVDDAWTLCAAPTATGVTTNPDNSLTVSWGSVTSATSYKIYRSTTIDGTYVYRNSTSNLNWTDSSGLSMGTEYFYKISAVNAGGESMLSNSVSGWTHPDSPSSVNVQSIENGLRVSWDAVTGAIGYKISRAPSASGTYAQIADTANTSYDDTDSELIVGKEYFYKVIAYNSGGDSSTDADGSGWYFPPVVFEEGEEPFETVTSANLHITFEDGQTALQLTGQGDLYLYGEIKYGIPNYRCINYDQDNFGHDVWAIRKKNESGNELEVLMLLALDQTQKTPIEISNPADNDAVVTTINLDPGDLWIQGAASVVDSFGESAMMFQIKETIEDGSPEETIAQLDIDGNLKIKKFNVNDTFDNKIHENIGVNSGQGSNQGFELNSAWIVNPEFSYSPSDLSYILNRGAAYDNILFQYEDGITTVPKKLTDPGSTGIYSMKNSIIGNGDNWVHTWVGNDLNTGFPTLVTANTDGYGISYYSYNSDTPKTSTDKYPIYEMPDVAVSKFTGYPGSLMNMSDQTGNLVLGHGETFNRFIWQKNTALGGINGPLSVYNYPTTVNYFNSGTYQIQNDINPTSLIFLPDNNTKPTSGSLYMGMCWQNKDFNPADPANANIASEIPGVPTVSTEVSNNCAPSSRAYIIKKKGTNGVFESNWNFETYKEKGVGSLFIAKADSDTNPYTDGTLTLPNDANFLGTYTTKEGVIDKVTIVNAGNTLWTGDDLTTVTVTDNSSANPAPDGAVIMAGTCDRVPMMSFSSKHGDGTTTPTINEVWDSFKFTTPNFVQFGMAYQDYDFAFPDSASTSKYVYAVSPHIRWWEEDKLYLGRVQVWDSTNGWDGDEMMTSSNWTYYTGLDANGDPEWDGDIDHATSILYAKDQCGWPSVVYHKQSGRFLMATYTLSGTRTWYGWDFPVNDIESVAYHGDNNRPVAGKSDSRWFLWEAPRPWGPWKRIMTSDFNGRQKIIDDPDGDGYDRHGFMGYHVELIPAWTMPMGDGWDIFVIQSGFANWIGVGGFYPSMHDMAENYTMETVRVHLSPHKRAVDQYPSMMGYYQQNNAIGNYDYDGQTGDGVGFTYDPEDPRITRIANQSITQDLDWNTSGTVGMLFAVDRPTTVTHLGRYYVSGNQQKHTLSLYRANGTTDTQVLLNSTTLLASVDIDLSQVVSQELDRHHFAYGLLDSGITLYPGKYYLLVSLESGDSVQGDHWFGGKSLNRNWVYDPQEDKYRYEIVQDLAEVYSGFTFKPLRAAMWYEDGANSGWDMKDPGDSDIYGNCYGPLNMRFNNQPLAFISGAASPSQVSYISSEKRLYGMKMTLPAGCRLMVTDLGRFRYSGSQKHEIRLMQDDELTSSTSSCGYLTLGSILIDAADSTSQEFQYESLTDPVLIGSHDQATVYYLVGREFSNSDVFATYTGDIEAMLGEKHNITLEKGYIAIDTSGNYSAWQTLGSGKLSVNMKLY